MQTPPHVPDFASLCSCPLTVDHVDHGGRRSHISCELSFSVLYKWHFYQLLASTIAIYLFSLSSVY